MKIKKIRIVLLLVFSLCFVKSFNVMASYEYATGGNNAPIGSGGSSSNNYYDCYSPYKRCPRWIKVPGSVYRNIVSNNYTVGSYSNLSNVCQTDNYVVIAGNQRKNNQIQIYNLLNNPFSNTNSLKTSHKRASVATSNTSTSISDFFGNKNEDGIKDSSGELMTYQEILDKVLNDTGVSETELAVFCPSMVKTEQYKLTGSAVDTSGGEITTTSGKWDSGLVDSGSPAEITAGSNSNYTFLGWSSSKTGGTPSGEKTYKVNSLIKNTEVFAIYGKIPTLTLVAKDKSGNILNSSMDSKKADKYNGSATVTANNINGYTFLGINDSNSVNSPYTVTARTRTKSNMISNQTVYAIYELNTFSGKIDIKDNKMDSATTTDWKNSNATVSKYVKCENDNCSVNYTHSLRRDTGNGSTTYDTSYRNGNTGNYTAIKTEGSWPEAVFNNVIRNSNPTIYTGGTYSEKLEFKKNINESVELVATVYAPYNFISSTRVKTEGGIVYAGETKVIEVEAKLNEKYNAVIGATYKTNSPNAKWKIQVKYDSDANWNDYGEQHNLANTENYETSLDIEDLEPGARIKVRSCIYPSNSGSDTNLDPDGSGEWACSDEKQFTIAKRPSFQVLGGSIYTAGGIKVSPIAVKKKIAGETDVPAGGKAFGSWVEQSVLAYGAVNGLASGSAITTSGNQTKTEYCKLVPLSFANYTFSNPNICPFYNTTGYFNGNSQSSIATTNANNIDLDSLINSIKANSNVAIEEYGNTNHGVDGFTLTSTSGTTIIEADNITINNNIIYDNAASYTNLNNIPKLIIYANGAGENGNINIACGVTQIDAILIAKNTIDTCSGKDQLAITGQIIAKTINLNRTYGAGPGMGPEGSATPAEIINYDASSILWNINTNNEDNYQGLTTVYMRELAPRY